MKTESDYSKKLRDPRWQKKRLEILEAAQWKCEDCGDDKAELQVHHSIYIKGFQPWDYSQNTLMALCSSCHTARQQLDSIAKIRFACLLRFLPIQSHQGITNLIGDLMRKDIRWQPKEEAE